MGVRDPLVYAILGLLVWIAFLDSGIHPTVGGVLIAMTIPAPSTLDKRKFIENANAMLNRLEEGDRMEVEAPAQRFEHALHPWVTFFVMPLFALSNAGVTFEQGIGALVMNSAALGAFLGLVLGKQLGITLFSWTAVKIGIASLPNAVTWRHIYGVGWLGGIGFTMSLFIASLAFGPSPALDASKLGIYAASVISGLGGLWILRRKVVVSKAGERREGG
jgi:NhaA family Na+:H+ antiporter